MEARYTPDVFYVRNEREAKNIILTPEGSTTDIRWEAETPFLTKDIGEFIKPDANTLMLDFGCGIGRISKALIDAYQCSMVGLDISLSMRQLALQYVKHNNFSAVGHQLLVNMLNKGLKVDACVSLWVLQHCPNVLQEVKLIHAILKPGGYFYVLNNNNSAIPTDKGWVSDGADIKAILEEHFTVLEYSKLPSECAPEGLIENTFIAKLQKPL